MDQNRMDFDIGADKLREECGVFGMYDFDGNDVARAIYYGLFALQHRGQESCGIAVSDTEGPKGKVAAHKGMGLCNEVFTPEALESLKGNIGVGHVRYSTAGSSTRENAQPLVLNYVKGILGLAHNGNLVNAPELRHELEYTGADGEKHRPIMIHRVCFGSIERFIGILIEHFAGAFPTWLAPVQVKVLPISEKYEEYAKSVKAALDAADIRAEIDLRSEKIGYKIREAQGQKIPYMLVVGQKEQADGTVSVRSRFKGDEGAEDLNVFIANIKAEIAGRVNCPVEVKKEEEK